MVAINSNNTSHIQAFPLKPGTVLISGGGNIDGNGRTIFRALGSGTLNLTFRGGNTLSISVEPGDDYALMDVETIDCDTDFMVS